MLYSERLFKIDLRADIAHDEINAGTLERLITVDELIRARRFFVGDGIEPYLGGRKLAELGCLFRKRDEILRALGDGVSDVRRRLLGRAVVFTNVDFQFGRCFVSLFGLFLTTKYTKYTKGFCVSLWLKWF